MILTARVNLFDRAPGSDVSRAGARVRDYCPAGTLPFSAE